jgi:hypothetical protein
LVRIEQPDPQTALAKLFEWQAMAEAGLREEYDSGAEGRWGDLSGVLRGEGAGVLSSGAEDDSGVHRALCDRTKETGSSEEDTVWSVGSESG